ncbi:hypothetical protein AB0E83_18955 [Streptomyces sp. NPDC035033]|uniref:hypothetical protein n=1 Tax=Streptomyces sp. NPDC035033 TaxID=3155368 RepID=UPI00340F1A1C
MSFIRERRRSVFLLLTPAFLLGTAALAGVATGGQGGLILLTWPREQAFLLAGTVLILLAVAVLRGLTKSPLRTALATLLLLLGVPSTWIGGTLGLYDHAEREVKTQAAPGRSDRRLVMVQHDDFDPARCLYVHQDGLLGERRWTVSCFMGEEDGLRDAVWTSPERIRITVDGTPRESHEVTILPSGQPERVLLYGSAICPGDLRGDCWSP